MYDKDHAEQGDMDSYSHADVEANFPRSSGSSSEVPFSEEFLYLIRAFNYWFHIFIA
jgi:hypothetical protein